MLTRDQLLERVWGYTFAGDTRTVDVHVRQLRRKLGDASPIVTVWGVGYKVSTARETQQKDRGARLGECRRVFSSLRVRLPLLFLAGIVLAGVVTTLIAIQLFQDFARDQTLHELRREASGIAQLYSSAWPRDFAAKRGSRAARRRSRAASLERATGDQIYFDGPVSPFPGENSGLPKLDLDTIDWTSGKTLTFEFTPPA